MDWESKLVIKRLIDVILAISFILLLLPLFLLILITISLESDGPIVYKHTRVGKDEKPFKMWKFRTMVAGADKMGPGLTKVQDPRITWFGKLLRRLSLDELPQLFNVLRGNMSIVGPRPEIPEIVRTYSFRQKRALSMKPGITGLSQVNGRDDLPIEKKLKYEIEYIENFSMALDLKILFMTLPVIISGRGNRY